MSIAATAKPRKTSEAIFKSRTSSAYSGMRSRMRKSVGREDEELSFDLAFFRLRVNEALGRGVCPYCGKDLKVRNFSPDHRIPAQRVDVGNLTVWGWGNIIIVCSACNKQKAMLTEEEFMALRDHVLKLPYFVARDVLLRLQVGASFRFGAQRRDAKK